MEGGGGRRGGGVDGTKSGGAGVKGWRSGVEGWDEWRCGGRGGEWSGKRFSRVPTVLFPFCQFPKNEETWRQKMFLHRHNFAVPELYSHENYC